MALTTLLLAFPCAADARTPPERVIQDDAAFVYATPEAAAANFAEARTLGFQTVRLTANWNALTREPQSKQKPDFDASEPSAYEQSRFDLLDRAVRLAQASGLKVNIDIAFWAPHWATSEAADEHPGLARTNIDVGHYREFSEAVVRRYSGSYVRPDERPKPAPEAGGGLFGLFGLRRQDPNVDEGAALPRVSVWTIWNEPNIAGFFEPQFLPGAHGRRRVVSPHLYRAMVQAAYPAVKALQPDATVLVGGTAMGGSYGVSNLRGGVAPKLFLRELACVDARLRPRRTGACANFQRVPGDGFAHHPYSFGVRPDLKSRGDNVRLGDLPELAALLRALVRRGRISPRMADIYINEAGYQTWRKRNGVSEARQARYWAWAEFLAWKLPQVKSSAQFLVRDIECAPDAAASCLSWHTGYRRTDGSLKPLAGAFSAGLYAKTRRRGGIYVWARTLPALQAQRVSVQVLTRHGWSGLPRSRTGRMRHHGGGVVTVRTRRLRNRVRALRLSYVTPDGIRRLTAPIPLDRGPRRR